MAALKSPFFLHANPSACAASASDRGDAVEEAGPGAREPVEDELGEGTGAEASAAAAAAGRRGAGAEAVGAAEVEA